MVQLDMNPVQLRLCRFDQNDMELLALSEMVELEMIVLHRLYIT